MKPRIYSWRKIISDANLVVLIKKFGWDSAIDVMRYLFHLAASQSLGAQLMGDI